MIEDLRLRNYSPETIQTYVRYIADFAGHFGRSPAELGPPHVRDYQVFLLDEKNGCTAGCKTGISTYELAEYNPPGIHDDQEGFCVLEGTGWARVGAVEFPIAPEGSFIVPAHHEHSLKKDPDSPPLKVFWFHAAV